MEKFIKVSLVGQGWDTSEIQTQRDYARFANLIAEYFHSVAPLDGVPRDTRNLTISVCDQVDRIHFIESDQPIIINI